MLPTSSTRTLEQARQSAVPASLLAALDRAGLDAWLVGGAVRDAVAGIGPRDPDVDVAVEGEIEPLLDLLGVESRTHERFGTAGLLLDGRPVDLARTRSESYAAPGALPDVEPATIDIDLARRDFTVNAMAIPLRGEARLLDPHDGLADLGAGLLRVLHEGSFRDDPTRALRAARYAARLDLVPEPATLALLAEADFGTVSDDRISAELLRIGAEPEAVRAFGLLEDWGVLELGPERRELLGEAAEYLATDPWSRLVQRAPLLATIATADQRLLQSTRALADLDPAAPAAELFEHARHHTDLELAIGRAMGAEWLDQHVSEWRRVELEIRGDDLIQAGVRQGPDVGRGLLAALHARVEGRIEGGREAELSVALAAAGGEPGRSIQQD